MLAANHVSRILTPISTRSARILLTRGLPASQPRLLDCVGCDINACGLAAGRATLRFPDRGQRRNRSDCLFDDLFEQDQSDGEIGNLLLTFQAGCRLRSSAIMRRCLLSLTQKRNGKFIFSTIRTRWRRGPIWSSRLCAVLPRASIFGCRLYSRGGRGRHDWVDDESKVKS